jgi:ribose transport system substrate-binding protein
MVRKRRVLLFALPLVCMAVAAGCGDDEGGGSSGSGSGGEATAASGEAKAASPECSEKGIISAKDWNEGPKKLPEPGDAGALEGKRVAFIGFGQDNVWSQWVFKAVNCEAQAWGAEAKFIGPPSFDAQVQFQLASDLAVSKNYDALVVVPNDSTSIAPALKQTVGADIPTVSVLQPAGPDVLSMKNQIPGMTGNVIEDLDVNATTMGEGVVDACEGVDPCKVIVIWGARALAFDKVKPKIFQEAIAGNDNIEIVCEADGGYDQDVGRTATADCLQANPDANVLASQADQQTRGAERAIEAAGKTFGNEGADIKIVSAYGTMHGVSQVRAGKWFQTSYNRAQSLGAAATRLALLAVGGEPASEDLSFLVQDRDFDTVPNKLDKEALEANPDVIGQWDG